jgi:PhzF family phenazine biosynthesis protein
MPCTPTAPRRRPSASPATSASWSPVPTTTAPSPWTSLPPSPLRRQPPTASQALGAKPHATYRTGALGDLLAAVDDEAAVRSLRSDFTALTRIIRRNGIRGIIVTAAAADRQSGYDFVSRYFAPASGISEDPVTGSAHTALAPYWSRRLGRASLTGLQASDRAGAVHGDRVHLTGHAVTVLDGGTLDHNAG